MTNLEAIRERYSKEPFNKRLGHLASDLARISSFIDNPANRAVVNDILEESKFFIEWIAPKAASSIQTILSDMQFKLAVWQRHLLLSKECFAEQKEVKRKTRYWSLRLLKISGLITV